MADAKRINGVRAACGVTHCASNHAVLSGSNAWPFYFSARCYTSGLTMYPPRQEYLVRYITGKVAKTSRDVGDNAVVCEKTLA